MMETVAWLRKSRKNETVKLSDFPMVDSPFNHKNWEEEPLVRLSDAEARIATLEAELSDMTAKAERQWAGWVKAEALLKEAGKVLEPFAQKANDLSERYPDDYRPDNTSNINMRHLRAARSLMSKIGERNG